MDTLKTQFGGFLLVSAMLASVPLQAGEKDVIVVNTPDVNVANVPDVNIANSPDVYVANMPAVQEVTGVIEATQTVDAVFLDGRACPKTTNRVFNLYFDIPEGMVLILEDATFQVVRCLGGEATAITTSQITAEVQAAVLGQFNDAVVGTGAFSGRAFNKQVKIYAKNSLGVRVWIDPPDYVDGFFFRGYGRLVPGERTTIFD